VPSAAGIFGFTIRQGAVELLGPASLSNGSPKDVSDLLGAPDAPTDDVEVVTGYLVRTPPISCPMPEQGLQTPVPDLSSFYCGGSWLTASPVRTANVGPGVDAVLVVDNGLHAQLGAYEQFAPDPAYDENYAIPREATYLIRNAGCPPVVMGDCPVWRMVGRLDDRATEPEATPLPTASLTPSPAEPSPSPEAVVLPPGIELNQAIGIARRVVAPDATLWGYAAGTYRDVRNLSPGADREVQPPDSITWDSLVWGIQFKSNVEICPPPPNAGQSPDPCETRPGLSSVYLDYHDGTWITTAIYSPSAGTPLPTPFHLMPVVSSPEPSSYAPDSSGPVFVSCPEALTTGRLVENADGGLDLERSDGTTVMVEWAFSLRVGTVNGRLAVVNANGEPLAYAGDLVEVGGGAVGAEGVAAWYACGGLTVLESAPPTAGP